MSDQNNWVWMAPRLKYFNAQSNNSHYKFTCTPHNATHIIMTMLSLTAYRGEKLLVFSFEFFRFSFAKNRLVFFWRTSSQRSWHLFPRRSVLLWNPLFTDSLLPQSVLLLMCWRCYPMIAMLLTNVTVPNFDCWSFWKWSPYSCALRSVWRMPDCQRLVVLMWFFGSECFAQLFTLYFTCGFLFNFALDST